jgi:hypothetical protein
VIRTDSTIFWRIGNSATTAVPTEVKLTTNEIGDIDCWWDKEECVICGPGGCVTVSLTETAITRLKHFRHDKYSVTISSATSKDMVIKTLIIQGTNFFFTVENMMAAGAGLMRWDSYSNSCYDRFQGSETGLTNHYYHLRHLHISRIVGLSIPEKNKLIVFDLRDISTAVKETVVTGTDRGFGAFDFYDREPEKMTVATCYPGSSNTARFCSYVNYLTGAVIGAVEVIMSGTAVDYNHRRAAVKFIPQDSFFFFALGGSSSASSRNIVIVNSKQFINTKHGTTGNDEFQSIAFPNDVDFQI